MRYLLYAGAVIAGLVLAAVLIVAALSLFATLRDEWRRRRETDLPPRIAQLRVDFFREDIERLKGVKLWVLWYEDRFDLENSSSFGISAHLTDASAREAFAARGRPQQPGFDGYTIEGPVEALETPLLGEQRVEVLRQVLERLKSGSAEPIPMKV